MIARVIIDSPLPQLDRLFDYTIPANLAESLNPGVRVKVPFGRSKSLMNAYVVEVVDHSDFDGKISEIQELVSPARVLVPEIFSLARSVADRQAATVSDVLRLAVPDRSVGVEKKWLESDSLKQHKDALTEGTRQTQIVDPVTTQDGPAWVTKVIECAGNTFKEGRSVIVVVPDFRDQEALIQGFAQTSLIDSVIDFSTNTQKSKRYENFLKCLSTDASIVVGSRASIYAPVRSLGLIISWDDGDENHQEPTSPYSHTREVSLIRQKQTNCNLLFLGHSRSAEIQRLVNLKYIEDTTELFALPKIAYSESDARVDSMAWSAIRIGLEQGPVLVQVSSRGNSTSVFCSKCNKRCECKTCNGPLWIDGKNIVRCRWCNAANLDYSCVECSSTKLKYGRAGATRTASELGKAFPGVQIIESTSQDIRKSVEAARCLVVATAGAEPRVRGGYAAVVILDANQGLMRDSIRATEDSIRKWSNAVALGKRGSKNILVGVSGSLATKFSLWSQVDLAQQELSSRIELRFPPAVRLASVGASRELIQEISNELTDSVGLEILGPLPIMEQGVEVEWRLLIKYDYSAGPHLANTLRAISLRLSAGQHRFSSRSGRAMRPIRIKMDDVEVI